MMDLPGGDLVRSRVVTDPGTVLTDALDCRLSGYAVLEPQGSLLLDGDGRGVLTFAEGVPVLAHYTGTGRGGPAALADLAVPGPYRCDLVSLPSTALADLHDRRDDRVPPGMPAERLAADESLATRTRRRAPAERTTDTAADDTDPADDAVAAFLDDEERIAAIREQARTEARKRAAEWGIEDLCSEE